MGLFNKKPIIIKRIEEVQDPITRRLDHYKKRKLKK